MSMEFISVEELKQRIIDRGHVWSGEELDVFAAAVIRTEHMRIRAESEHYAGDPFAKVSSYYVVPDPILDPKEEV